MLENVDTLETPKFTIKFKTREGVEESGPLDLLWSLIESYQVDIFQVSLSRITDDFIAHMQQKDLDLDQESEFALMAARLLYYKSKLLLPDPGYEDTYEDDSLPFELVDQLLEYKRFQKAAESLRDLEEQANMIYSTDSTWVDFEQDVNFVDLDLVNLLSAFRDFLEKKERLKPVEIEDETFTLEELIEEFRQDINKVAQLSFFAYVKEFSLLRCIGMFLAVLELMRLREIYIEQSEAYKDLLITPRLREEVES